MNHELTEAQIDYICRDMQKKGLYYRTLAGELTDHICCAVEADMQKGLSFQEAYANVLAQFGPDGLAGVQDRTVQLVKRPAIVKKMILYSSAVAASLFLVVLVGQANANNRPDIDPIFHSTQAKYHQIHVCPNVKLALGVDYLVPAGTAVIATSSGEIEATGDDTTGYGKYILLRHNETYVTRYAHLSELVVATGQQIKKGEVIGYAGKTGDATEPHLHYELIRNGKTIDIHPLSVYP